MERGMADIRAICGGSTGCGPNTTAHIYRTVALPKFEYGAAVWAPWLTKAQWDVIEHSQMRFARRILGCGSDAANAFVTGELGLRSIRGHCEELALRWFGELTHIPHGRLIGRIFRARIDDARHFSHRHRLRKSDPGCDAAAIATFNANHSQCAARALYVGKYSWGMSMQKVFAKYGLIAYWDGTKSIPSKGEWCTIAHNAVTKHDVMQWRGEIAKLSTLRDRYPALKGKRTLRPSPDRSLNDRRCAGGRRLKLQCRAGTLPTNYRKYKLSHSSFKGKPHDESKCERLKVCSWCSSGADDTIEHVFFDCDPAQSTQLIQLIHRQLNELNMYHVIDRMNAMSRSDLLLLLLGCTFSDRRDKKFTRMLNEPDVYSAIDVNVKRFLMATFKRRDRAIGSDVRTAMFASLNRATDCDREPVPIATLPDEVSDAESLDDDESALQTPAPMAGSDAITSIACSPHTRPHRCVRPSGTTVLDDNNIPFSPLCPSPPVSCECQMSVNSPSALFVSMPRSQA